MRFPIIKNADQVLKAIDGNHAFIVKRDEENDLLIINYVLNTPDTFPPFGDDPVENERLALLRECRGITFRLSTGELISRPLHKFFNIGERRDVDPEAIDFNKPHRILTKLDGSMLRPIMTKNGLRWGTKMGVTDVAKIAEEFINNNNTQYNDFATWCIKSDLTPIFEWCSLKQRIVISYSEDNLILIAVRHNFTGEYLNIHL